MTRLRAFLIFALILTTTGLWGLDEAGFITGIVVSKDSGEPLPGATVRLQMLGRSCPDAETLTDANGSFLFMSVHVGRYRLTAVKSGYQRVSYGQEITNPIGLEVVVSPASPTYDLNFALPAAASVSGHIYDSSGNAVTESFVFFESATAPWRTFRAETDKTGFYSTTELPPDFYRISARGYSQELEQLVGDLWYYPGTTVEIDSEVVVLEEGKSAVIDISFREPPIPIWSVQVHGPNGEPVEKADVSFLQAGGGTPGIQTLFGCRTDPDGNCHVQELAAGDYWVYLQQTPAPYVMPYQPGTDGGKRLEEFARPLHIDPEQPAETEFRLSEGKRIAIHLYAPGGAPAASDTGLNVTLKHYRDLGRLKLPLIAGVRQISANTVEAYVHPLLEYEVVITQKDPNARFVVTRAVWNGSDLAGSNRIQADSAEPTLELWLERSSILSGSAPTAKVVYAERIEGMPVPEQLYPASLLRTRVQQGAFLLRGLPPGTYRLHKDKPDGPFVVMTVQAGESKTVSIE